MHLFYYQQGLLTDEVEPSLLLEVPVPGSAGTAEKWCRSSHIETPFLTMSIPHSLSLSPPQVGSSAVVTSRIVGAGVPASLQMEATSSGETGPQNTEQAVAELRERYSELEWRVAEHGALESQILQMQEKFMMLQDEFKQEKEHFGEQVASLGSALEDQQVATVDAEKRVICKEDLVRFHEEQRRLLAGHWKSQCQQKDERIRFLNLQLTEYTIDWQNLGTQKQTEASLSHETQCLRDRHEELRAASARRYARCEGLMSRLAAAKAEEGELQHAVEAAEAAEAVENSSRSEVGSDSGTEASALLAAKVHNLGLHRQLQELARCRSTRDARTAPADPHWPHACIWRDELDVRERQLEKIITQLDRTNSALHRAQAALALQRARHEEMKNEHRDAETNLRNCETRRTILRRQVTDLRRAEDGLQRALDEELGPGAKAGTQRGSHPHVAGQPPRQTLSLQERISAITLETQKLVESQQRRGGQQQSLKLQRELLSQEIKPCTGGDGPEIGLAESDKLDKG